MKSVAPYGVVTSATPLVPQERESRSRKALPLAVVGVALCLTAAACVLGTQSGSALVSGVSHRGFFRRQISKFGNGNRKLKLFNDHWMRCYDTKTDGDYNKIGDGLVETGKKHRFPLLQLLMKARGRAQKRMLEKVKAVNERATCRCKKGGAVPEPVTGSEPCGDQNASCVVNGKRTVKYQLWYGLHINGQKETHTVKFSYPVKIDPNTGRNLYNDSTLGKRIKGASECGGRFSGKNYGAPEKLKRGVKGMTKLAYGLDKWMFAEELQQCCVEHDYGYMIPGSSKAEVDLNFRSCMLDVCDQKGGWKQQDTDHVPAGDVVDPTDWEYTKMQHGRRRNTPFAMTRDSPAGLIFAGNSVRKCYKSAEMAYKGVQMGGMLTYTKGQACNSKCGEKHEAAAGC